jgi:hypothetical protein
MSLVGCHKALLAIPSALHEQTEDYSSGKILQGAKILTLKQNDSQ